MNRENVLNRANEFEESFRLGVVGTIGLALSFIIPMLFFEKDWFKPYWMPTFWLGIASFLTFIALSIEVAFKDYWKYGALKLAGALVFSMLVLSANALAASDINGVFGIDASALPYTFAVITAAEFVVILKPVFILLCVLGGLMLLVRLTEWHTNGSPRYVATLFAIGGLIGGGYPWFVINQYLNDEELPLKIYTVAHRLDFGKKYNCTNLKPGHSVVFLGPSQSRVLVDVRVELSDDPRDYIYMIKKSSPITVPNNFVIAGCAVAGLAR
jgi:hypothetical protein